MLVWICVLTVYTIITGVLTFQVTENIGDFFFVFMVVFCGMIPVFVVEYCGRFVSTLIRWWT